MEIKQIISISPVSRPTWAKMCTTIEDSNGCLKQNTSDWWYVEVVQWANVICIDDGIEYPAIFGYYMESECDGGGLDFVEKWTCGHLHYTTQEPAYMDCVDGGDVEKVIRSEKFSSVAEEDLIAALDRAKGNKTIAARLLGVHRATIFNVISKYGLKDKYIRPYKKIK